MHILKIWHERLFRLERGDFVPRKAKISLDFVPITEENAELVRDLRAPEYVQAFKRHLALGDFGYYAFLDGAPVGYGWAKHEGSDDFFFKVGEGMAYLCRFFVREEMRGQGIYPELITNLIEKEADENVFYIAVERGNESSERGLKKVGFSFVKGKKFVRLMGLTINKTKLFK